MVDVNQITSSLGPAYNKDYQVNGVTLGPPFPKEIVKKVSDFPFTPNDILLVSYPRSGEDFLSDIVWLLMNDADTFGARNIPSTDRLPLMELEGMNGYECALESLIERGSPRAMRTHLPYSLMGTAIERGRPKVICVVRDPREVVTSQYRSYMQWPGRGVPSFRFFFDKFFKSKNVLFGCYFQHVLGYWRKLKEPNFLVLKYEDLRTEIENNILKIAHFLSKDLKPKPMHTIVKYMLQHVDARPKGNVKVPMYIKTITQVGTFESDCYGNASGENAREESKPTDSSESQDELKKENIMDSNPAAPLEVVIFSEPKLIELSKLQALLVDKQCERYLKPHGLMY